MPTGIYIRSSEHRKKLSEAARGNKHRLGCRHSEETKAKIAQSQRGRHHTEETKTKISQSLKGWSPTEEGRATLSQAMRANQNRLGKHHSIESRMAISQAHSGRHYSQETKRLLSRLLVKRYQNPEARAKMSRALKKRFQDPAYKERISKAVMLGSHIRPTKPESILNDLLEQHFPGQWKYVGDGQLIIGGKNPDFANINGKKQLIELFGTYWHDIFDVAKRTEHFRGYGFRTLIIWEDELTDEVKVVKKVKSLRRLRQR